MSRIFDNTKIWEGKGFRDPFFSLNSPNEGENEVLMSHAYLSLEDINLPILNVDVIPKLL